MALEVAEPRLIEEGGWTVARKTTKTRTGTVGGRGTVWYLERGGIPVAGADARGCKPTWFARDGIDTSWQAFDADAPPPGADTPGGAT